jgi:hypothetical protein
MRFGVDDRWIELEVVGYESPASPGADEEYDLGTDWLVLRADVSDGTRLREYRGLSVYVDECIELARWLGNIATSAVGASNGDGRSRIWFAEPDVAAQLVQREGESLTVQWIFYDEHSGERSPSDFMNYSAATYDITGTAEGAAVAAYALTESFKALVSRRDAEVRVAGGTVGADPTES